MARELRERGLSPRGELIFACCRSGSHIATQVIERYRQLASESGSRDEITFLESVDFRFEDTETCVRLGRDVRGCDVFLFQALFEPGGGRCVDENYMAFLIAARTFREWGAGHVTAVLPYLAYVRQDKPTRGQREPTTAQLMADLGAEAGIDRLITWHAHCNQIHEFYRTMPVTSIEALPFFEKGFKRFRDRGDVITVAPDAGASHFITNFGHAMNLRYAIASKLRPEPGEAVITEIIGDFEGKRTAVVLDDMISSGGTVYELIKTLVEQKEIEEVYLGASHNLCMPKAAGRLRELHSHYHLKEVMVTDTIPQTREFTSLPFFSVKSVSDTLTRVINRIHFDEPVSAFSLRDEDKLKE
jgi:ribose-phosphate pyrophosphokinase